MTTKDDYPVGYGRPPRHTRFKKGQSGNPKGTVKGALRLAAVLDKALNERVTITERGRRKSVTKLEVMMKQLVNKAASGEHRSQQLLLAIVRVHEDRLEKVPEGTAAPLREADEQVMKTLIARVRELPEQTS